jgi:hypothetical protein
MAVFAMAGSLGVMLRAVGTMLAVDCGGCSQLQPSALPPRRCAGDKREGDCQNQNMATNTTHHRMVVGLAESHQQIFDRCRQLAVTPR